MNRKESDDDGLRAGKRVGPGRGDKARSVQGRGSLEA